MQGSGDDVKTKLVTMPVTPQGVKAETLSPKSGFQSAGSQVVFESIGGSGDDAPRIAFVNVTGHGKNSAKVQRSIRQHVMHSIGKSRRVAGVGCKKADPPQLQSIPIRVVQPT
jgi:hypothetical protein